MKFLFITFIILLITLFIPFPLKLALYASKNDFYLKLYGYTIVSQENLKKKKNKENKLFKKFDFNISNSKKFASRLYYSKLKPFLNININFVYSFNDAAKTAISYGIFGEVPNLIYLALKIPFKLHKYDFNIKPIFKEDVILNFEIKSIIFLSFAHIINILILMIKSYKKSLKEVAP